MELEHKFSITQKPKSTRIIPEDERPKGYGKHSATAYYNIDCAKSVQKWLDKLDLEDKSNILYFPIPKYKTVRTIYDQIYYGFRFLIERLDPDKKYLALRQQLSIKKEKNRIKVYWKPLRRVTILEDGEVFNIKQDEQATHEHSNVINNWQTTLVKWAENSPDPSTCQQRINLDMDEIQWIRDYLLSGFSNNIVIVYINPSGYKLAKNTRLVEAMKREK